MKKFIEYLNEVDRRASSNSLLDISGDNVNKILKQINDHGVFRAFRYDIDDKNQFDSITLSFFIDYIKNIDNNSEKQKIVNKIKKYKGDNSDSYIIYLNMFDNIKRFNRGFLETIKRQLEINQNMLVSGSIKDVSQLGTSPSVYFVDKKLLKEISPQEVNKVSRGENVIHNGEMVIYKLDNAKIDEDLKGNASKFRELLEKDMKEGHTFFHKGGRLFMIPRATGTSKFNPSLSKKNRKNFGIISQIENLADLNKSYVFFDRQNKAILYNFLKRNGYSDQELHDEYPKLYKHFEDIVDVFDQKLRKR